MRFLIFTLALCLSLFAQAQQIDGSFNPSSNFLPKSPEAATIMMFQDLPTNPYTGTASIAVPITSMSEHDLSVNISLQYHSSSVPVNTLSNWVGANWKLNGVSMISRKTKGIPDDADLGMGFLEFRENFNYEDDDSDPDNSVLDWLTHQNTDRFEQLSSGCFDVAPDEFYFDLNGSGSGTFAFDWENDMPIVNSADDVEVVYYEKAPNSNQIILWELKDAKGVIYTFSDLEITSSESDFSFYNICNSGTQVFTSSWYLTKMESPNIVHNSGLHYIEFLYEDYTLDYDWQWFETRTFSIATNNIDCGAISSMPNISSSRTIIYGKRISAIRTANNYFSIDFISNNLRSDIQDLNDAQNFSRLDEIQVKGSTGNILYSYALDYEYKGRLLLKSVQKTGSDGTTLPPYVFEYNNGSMPNIKSKAIDHWGFYNGAPNTTLLPNYLHKLVGGPFIYFQGGNRNPSLTHALTNVMSSVTYPTGGKVLLDYELNEYSSINGLLVENQNQYIATPVEKTIQANSQLNNGDFIESTSAVFPMSSPEDEVLVEVTITGETSATFGGDNFLPQAWIEDQNGNPVASYILEPALDENGNNIAPYFQSFKRHILLPPGSYQLRAKARTFAGATEIDYININIKWSDVDVTMPLIRKTGGGVRLKEIIYQDGNGTETNRRSFRYEMDDGTAYSSGAIYAEPKYTYESTNIIGSQGSGIVDCDYVQVVGASRHVLSNTSGSYLGYRRVEESIGINGIGGKIVHEFISPHSAADGIDFEKPFGPPLSNGFKTGLSSRQTFYDKDGTMVQQIDQDYFYPQTDIPSAKITLGKLAPPPYMGSLQALLALGADYETRDFGDKFAWSFRPLRLGLSLPSNNTTWLDGLSQTTTYTYESQYEHHQPISTTTTNSDGKIHRTDIKYAKEISTDANVSQALRDVALLMLNRNMVAIPLEQRQYVDNVLQSGGRTEYAFFQGTQMILPQRFVQILHTDEEVERGTIGGYTIDAYPTATTRRGYPERTYDWTNGLLNSSQYGTWTESYTYFPNTRLRESHTAIDGQVTNLTYDGLQRLKTATSRGGAVVTTNDYNYSYATEGSPNWIQSQTVFSDDTPSQTSIQTFDGSGRSLKTLVNGVLKNEIIYDNIGRVDRQTHLPGNFTTFEYDDSPLNRVKKQIFPDGHFTQNLYSAENGYFKSIFTDENLKQTTTLTDILGRTERVINADGNATIYEYDDRNNLKKVIPPLGDQAKLIFEYEYDARNRATHVTIPGAGQKVLTYYDTHDLLQTTTDANGNQLEFFYDEYGRESTTELDGTVIRSSFYDENGGINIGKITRSQVKILGAVNDLETVYQYDSFGRLQQTTADNHIYNMGQQGSDVMTTTYNHDDWVTHSLRHHVGYENLDIAQSFDYDNFGRVTETTHSINGEQGAILSNNGWNNRDQMTRKVIGDNLQSVDYLYNERGWLTRINQPLDLFGPPPGQTPACDVSGSFVNTLSDMEASVFCGLQEIDLTTLFSERFDMSQNISLDCYNPCEHTGGVQGQPTCSAQEQSDQLASLAIAQIATKNNYATTSTQNCTDGSTQEVIRPNISNVMFPTTLYRLRLCDESEVYVFEDALQNITGTYYIVQEIEITDARQLFTVANNYGIDQTVNLEQLLLMVLEGENVAVDDYQHNTGSCEPTPPDCSPEEQQDQQFALSQIMGTGFAPPNVEDITFPTTLQRVLLCDGTEVYLFPDELAQIPGTYTILQSIAVADATQLFDRGNTITGLDLEDLFCLGLYYTENNPGYSTPQRKNGDIAWMTWQSKGSTTQSYSFRYDNLNRLTKAYHSYIDGNMDYTSNEHYDAAFSYDANGNISSLTRNRMPSSSAICGVQMDNLTYTYNYANFGNQLLNIVDGAEADKGFKYNSSATNYVYDLNGNLTTDNHKGYTATYNFLNLPEVFDFGDGKTVDLLYDADGTKLRKTVLGTDGTTTPYVKEYCHGIEYKNGVLEAIYHEEGRTVRDGNGDFEYQYVLRDQIGNTRVMFSDGNRDGKVVESEVIEINDFYPYGLRFQGNYSDASHPDNDYKFSNKELNGDFGLELYDHGARWRDPAAVIWGGVDVLAGDYMSWSPYNAMLGNPIIFTDSDGRSVDCPPWICGALAGAAVEIGSQVLLGRAKGGSWKKAIQEIDVVDVFAATVEGGISGGGSVAKRLFITGVSEAVQSAADFKLSGESDIIGVGKSKKSVASVVSDVAIGLVAGSLGDKATKEIVDSSTDKALKQATSDLRAANRNLRKTENVRKHGNNGGAKTVRADLAKKNQREALSTLHKNKVLNATVGSNRATSSFTEFGISVTIDAMKDGAKANRDQILKNK